MQLVLTRTNLTDEETLGTLEIDSTFFGYTLELPEMKSWEIKDNGLTHNMIKKCIPKGQYKVKVTYSNHMNKKLPLIYNQDSTLAIITPQGRWDGVRFHEGNTYLDSLACVLVARNKYLNKPSGIYDKAHHNITNWIQGSLSDNLSKLLDNGQIHNLLIK